MGIVRHFGKYGYSLVGGDKLNDSLSYVSVQGERASLALSGDNCTRTNVWVSLSAILIHVLQ